MCGGEGGGDCGLEGARVSDLFFTKNPKSKVNKKKKIGWGRGWSK